MRLASVALTLTATAIIAFLVNIAGATGGHCDDSGCSANFPDWLYEASGVTVLMAAAAVVVIAVVGLIRRLRR